ncbi:PHB depolymerase family esterase [Fulvimarina sp. 2208YS6-2-32]|uniref:PHB depolymerase family esterase n=1 Tax=Fulvimarina uroteuthidis TaxID=3098149 RepID=A0ABU5HZC7_9HYPH|nr:PHB depolymerase family esterase [Fulvimarina sp. 2208YS6-2-32]MDY8108160.1 PHB depolymerase family esterase [Fulvimarina sp. 2208YS6-2-32]
MRNPFLTLIKTTRRARKAQLASVRAVETMLAPAKPKARPRRKSTPKISAAMLKTLAAKPRPKAAVPRTPSRPVRPAPGSFVDGEFASSCGKLAYKLYTPIGSARRALPLVVMLHGCGQTADNFATGTGMNALADEIGFLVLYPEQSKSANINRCWNWHLAGSQKRGSGEPAKIAELTQAIAGLSKANRSRIYIAGISAGGAEAAIVAAAYPELFAAVGVHSGLPRGEVRTINTALSAMRNGSEGTPSASQTRTHPIIVFHGDEDHVVNPLNVDGFVADALALAPGAVSSRIETGRSKGGRAFTCTVYRHKREKPMIETWIVHGSGHAWSGGSVFGRNTDPAGPDASREMIRFFLGFRNRTPATSLPA